MLFPLVGCEPLGRPACLPPSCGDLIARGLTTNVRLAVGTAPPRPLPCPAHQLTDCHDCDSPAEWTSSGGVPRDRMLALLHRAQRRAAISPFGTDLLLLFADWAEEAARSFADPHHPTAQDWQAVAALARDGAAELQPVLPGAAP